MDGPAVSPATAPTSTKRSRLAVATLAVGLASAALLALSTTGTVSAFVASITNITNSAASGTVVMTETASSGTPASCTSGISPTAASCLINKFGGSTTMVPGVPVVTTVTIANTGTGSVGSFTLTPGPTCTVTANGANTGSASDTAYCAKMNLLIRSGSTTVFTGNLGGFKGGAAIPLTAPTGSTPVSFVFTVTLDGSADNTYEGRSASVPMTWAFSS